MSDTLAPSSSSRLVEAYDLRQTVTGMLPDWFRNLQSEAWERYQALPSPVRADEQWRFANLKPFTAIEEFQPNPLGGVDADDLVARSERLENVAGRFVFVDDNLAAPRYLDPEVEAKGVIFTTLIDALNQHGDLVRRYFMQQTPELGSEKFEALHVAMLRSGVFLHIPKGVEIEAPFVVAQWNRKPGTAIFPHTLFVCEDNASGHLVEFQESADPEGENLVIANAHVFAGPGSRPKHTIVQNWSRKTLSLQLNTSNAQRDVTSQGTIINIGSSLTRQEIHGKIFGSGADVNLYSLNVPDGEQLMDQRTLQTHLAPNSRSDLLYKNALLDRSKTIFSGLIIVGDDAQQTDAYQTNNNLMLSDAAEANSLPGLEIKANDVKCSHGATSGKIDDSNIFYFLARGIPRKRAEELMVFGFFEEIIGKIGHESVERHVRDLLERKFL